MTRPTSRERARSVPVSSTPTSPPALTTAFDSEEPSHRPAVKGSPCASDKQGNGATKSSEQQKQQQQQEPMAVSSASAATGIEAPAVATPFGKSGSNNRRDGINNNINALSSSYGVEARTNRDLAGSSPSSPSLNLGGKGGVETQCTAGMTESASNEIDSRERNPKWFMTNSGLDVVRSSGKASTGESASGVGGRTSRERASSSSSRGNSGTAAASPPLTMPVENRSSGDALSVNGDSGGSEGGLGRREAQNDCRAGEEKPTESVEASAVEGVGDGADIEVGVEEEGGNGDGASDDEANVWFERQAGNSRKTEMEETSASGAGEAAPASSSSSGGGGSSTRGRAGGGRITSSRPPRSGGGKSGGAVVGGKISRVVQEGKGSEARAAPRTESLAGTGGRSVGDTIPANPVVSGKDSCKPKEKGGKLDVLRRPTTVDELLDCLVEHRDSEGK